MRGREEGHDYFTIFPHSLINKSLQSRNSATLSKYLCSTASLFQSSFSSSKMSFPGLPRSLLDISIFVFEAFIR